jgi:hypothetical protein
MDLNALKYHGKSFCRTPSFPVGWKLSCERRDGGIGIVFVYFAQTTVCALFLFTDVMFDDFVKVLIL